MYFQVDVPGWRDEEFSQLCLDILKCGNTVFHLDDIDGVATANQIPHGLTTMWTTGRSRKVPCSACHQWTTSLPRVIKGQADAWCVYYMADPRDMDEAARYTDTPGMRRPDKGGVQLPEYYWWYWHRKMRGGARLMPPVSPV